MDAYTICMKCYDSNVTTWIKCEASSTTAMWNHSKLHEEVKAKTNALESAFMNAKSMQLRYHEKLCRHIIFDNQPVSQVESPYLRALVTGPHVARLTITNSISSLSSRVERIVTDYLKSVQSVSITTDGSSFYTNVNFIVVTAHFFVGWVLRSAVLGFSHVEESETSVFLSSFVDDIVKHWAISGKTSAIVTDNGANFLSACKGLVAQDKVEEQIRCACHNFHLVVCKSLQDVPPLQALVNKCSSIVSRITNTKSLLGLFKYLQSQKDHPLALMKENTTRWNSTYFMLARLIELKDVIEKSQRAEEMKDLLIAKEEWVTMGQLSTVLEPIMSCSKILEGEKYATLGKFEFTFEM